MDSRVNHHRLLVGVYVRDFLIHLEEVAVTLADLVFAEPFDGGLEVQEHCLSGLVHAVSGIASFLCRT